MEKKIKEIEKLYMERIALYRNLLSCVKQERENLINQDVKGIWDSLDEKNKILHSIMDINSLLDGLKEKAEEKYSVEDKKNFLRLANTLNTLKQEVGVRLKENIIFIRDTLGFINDIFSIFIRGENTEKTYGRYGTRHNEPANLLYHNEA